MKEDIVTPDKANAVFMAGLSFPLKEHGPAVIDAIEGLLQSIAA